MLSEKLCKKPPSVTARATSQFITKIDIVPPRYQDCTDLFLSHNSISSLKNIEQFRSTQRLMVEFNNIQNIDDLEPLSKLKKLKELKIEGNPVCRFPFYEYHIISMCENLEYLNGKQIKKDEAVKNAKYENELTKALYYSQLLSKSIQLQNRNPPLTNDKISKTLTDEMKKFKLRDFRRKFYKNGPKDIEGYKKYIHNQCCILENNIQARFSPKFADKFKENHKKNNEMIKNSKDLGDLSKVMNKQLANDLHLIGFTTDQEYTDSLTTTAKNDKYTKGVCDDWKKIAKLYTDNDYAEKKRESIIINLPKVPKPKKKENKITKKASYLFSFPNKRRKDTFRAMKHAIRTKLGDNKELKEKLENDLKREILNTIRFNRPSLVIDPNSTVSFAMNLAAEPPKIEKSKLQIIMNTPEEIESDNVERKVESTTIIEPRRIKPLLMRRTRASTMVINKRRNDEEADSDGAERMELNFESQLKKELVDQKSSMGQKEATSDGSFDDSFAMESRSISDAYIQKNLMNNKVWPLKKPPKVPNPMSREARRFSSADWEVKIFVEKLQHNIKKRVFSAWRSLNDIEETINRGVKHHRKNRRASMNSVLTPEFQSDNFFAGDKFLSEFLNSQSPAPRRRRSKSRRSSFKYESSDFS